MKSELLNQISESQAVINGELAQIKSLAEQLPDDPIPAPDALTGLSVVSVYGFPSNPDDSVTHIELTWSDPDQGCQPVLEVIAAPGNPNAPHEWTNIPVNGSRGPNGEWATHHLNSPSGQAIIFRLSQIRSSDGAQSAFVELAFPTL